MSGFITIWEYAVPAAAIPDFLAAYGPNGAWVRLFKEAAGYERTEFYRDPDFPGRFVTIDHWESQEAYAVFRGANQAKYAAIDHETEALTTSERHLGSFTPAS